MKMTTQGLVIGLAGLVVVLGAWTYFSSNGVPWHQSQQQGQQGGQQGGPRRGQQQSQRQKSQQGGQQGGQQNQQQSGQNDEEDEAEGNPEDWTEEDLKTWLENVSALHFVCHVPGVRL